MMTQTPVIISICISVAASFISGWIMLQMRRRQAKQDQIDERVRQIEIKQAEQLGEEKLRQIIGDELAKWELCLMKEGRIRRRNE